MSSNLNTNKIAAAILLAGLIGMVSGKVTEFLYDGGPEHPGHHEEARGYKIDVPEEGATGAGGAAAPAQAADISALYATADKAAGEAYFQKKCTVCHNGEKGGANKVGPHLWGVMGRKVASVSDFAYSEGMKKHAAEVPTWTWDAMNRFQWSPRKTVPGTAMSYAGTPKDQERANLIVYLNSQSDNPLPLPPVTKAAEPATEEGTAKTDNAETAGTENTEKETAKAKTGDDSAH